MKILVTASGNDRVIKFAKALFQIQMERAVEGLGVSYFPQWRMLSDSDQQTYCEMAMAAQQEFEKK